MEETFSEKTRFDSWEDQAGDLLNEKGICETIPDFIVADINKLEKVDNTPLRQIAHPYSFPLSYEETKDLCRLKYKFQHDSKYFSMSLPQVGVPKQGFVYFVPRELKKLQAKDKKKVQILLNASYEPDEDTDILLDYEKCASVKDICGLVPRFHNIKYKAYDVYGELIERKAFGFEARYIQHEIDHLNGLLFIDQAMRIITIKEHRFRRKRGNLIWYLDVQ